MADSVQSELESLAQQLRDSELRVKQLEKDLADAKSNKTQLEQIVIPDVMFQHGLTSIRLTNGQGIEVKPFYYARINKELKDKFFEWLRANNHGGLIKSHLEVWSRDPDMIQLTKDVLKEVGVPFDTNEDIHWKTLEAWYKEQVTGHQQINTDLFDNHVGNKAKLS